MKNKILLGVTTTLVISSLVFSLPVFAQGGSTTASTTRERMGKRGPGVPPPGLQKKMENEQNRGNQMIDQRIKSLNDLLARIQGLKNVSDANKALLSASVQSVINSLNVLRSEIASDTASTTLKNDLKHITESNRVYALVMPQTKIIIAGDRIQTIVAMMNEIFAKLQSRISGGTATSTLATSTKIMTAMNDITAKMNDANTKAIAAINEVTVLTPDQGDKTKLSANNAALKDANAKIKAANKDITAGRKDIENILRALIKL